MICPKPSWTYLPNSCCELPSVTPSAMPILPQPTNTHLAWPYRKPQHPQLTLVSSLPCWPKSPPTEARHYEILRPITQTYPDHQQPNLPKANCKSTRPGVTKLSSKTAAGHCSTSVFLPKSKRTLMHFTIYCDRGRDTPIRRIQRTGRFSPDSGIAGSNFALGSCATGGRRSASLSTSMKTGATL